MNQPGHMSLYGGNFMLGMSTMATLKGDYTAALIGVVISGFCYVLAFALKRSDS